MHLAEALTHVFGEIRESAHAVVDGLDANALAWQPDAQANSIAWLVWHLARVADDHVAEIAGREQVWDEGSWAQQLGLGRGYTDTGYGHTPQQVREVRPDGDALLLYVDAVTGIVRAHLKHAQDADFDRIIDRSYDPAVTVGVRFMSVVGDAMQHLGQAAYVRGLLERSP